VCVCEKEKKNVKGEKMGSFEKLWGDNPLGPKKKFHLRQTCAISVALWSFHANSAQYANGVRFQDQFFKVFFISAFYAYVLLLYAINIKILTKLGVPPRKSLFYVMSSTHFEEITVRLVKSSTYTEQFHPRNRA
jgi:hypothetical protein